MDKRVAILFKRRWFFSSKNIFSNPPHMQTLLKIKTKFPYHCIKWQNKSLSGIERIMWSLEHGLAGINVSMWYAGPVSTVDFRHGGSRIMQLWIQRRPWAQKLNSFGNSPLWMMQKSHLGTKSAWTQPPLYSRRVLEAPPQVSVHAVDGTSTLSFLSTWRKKNELRTWFGLRGSQGI